MVDILETIHGSMVQHGKHNDRIYVMHLDSTGEDALLRMLEKLARDHDYRKIFAKIPETSWDTFKSAGFAKEAEVPLLFSGKRDCYFVSKFFADRQHTDEDFTVLEGIIAEADPQKVEETDGDGQPMVERCFLADTEELALFYQNVFASYPFPILEPTYLAKMMSEDVVYYCIRSKNKIIAAAATESDPKDNYAEVTDFATAPDWRNQGLAASLLNRMERDLESAGILTSFTIARATSYGMNMVFKKRGYNYSGLLVNNTQISGRIESMTVWYKRLQERNTPWIA